MSERMRIGYDWNSRKKLDVLVKRELYTKYKTAKSATEREAARQEYLEKVGMPKDFRW